MYISIFWKLIGNNVRLMPLTSWRSWTTSWISPLTNSASKLLMWIWMVMWMTMTSRRLWKSSWAANEAHEPSWNKEPSLDWARVLFRGAWRIRTAVDGFADRWLSHSSKAPYSECGCKGTKKKWKAKSEKWKVTAGWLFLTIKGLSLDLFAFIAHSVADGAAFLFGAFLSQRATFTGIILVGKRLIYPPSGIADTTRQDH